MGRNEQDKYGHLSIFTSLKHLMVLLRCNFFSGLNFKTISKTLIGHAAQIFKSENIVENGWLKDEHRSRLVRRRKKTYVLPAIFP